MIPNGDYAASVSLTGGSGKAYIKSPCKVSITGGNAVADIIWSSSNYDYMIVGGKTYYPVSTDDGSEFEIPVRIGKEMKVQADTTAMGSPHLIDYTLIFNIGDEEKTLTDTEDEVMVRSDMAPIDLKGITYISTDESSLQKNTRFTGMTRILLCWQ